MMARLAHATLRELQSGLDAVGLPSSRDLRPPEIGLVMLRGRIGGDGQPFNVGEATVTRAAIQLASGERGFSYLLGRHPEKARLAAIVDALWQKMETRRAVEQHILTPIGARRSRDALAAKERVAATKVDFFTVARGEDEP